MINNQTKLEHKIKKQVQLTLITEDLSCIKFNRKNKTMVADADRILNKMIADKNLNKDDLLTLLKIKTYVDSYVNKADINKMFHIIQLKK